MESLIGHTILNWISFSCFQSDLNVISDYFWNTNCLWSAETLENEDYDALARRRRRKIWGIFGLYLGRLLRIPPLVYYRSTTRGGILNINTPDRFWTEKTLESTRVMFWTIPLSLSSRNAALWPATHAPRNRSDAFWILNLKDFGTLCAARNGLVLEAEAQVS